MDKIQSCENECHVISEKTTMTNQQNNKLERKIKRIIGARSFKTLKECKDKINSADEYSDMSLNKFLMLFQQQNRLYDAQR
tara:strand:- start:783 stop:1025 length:243 start_codon:yes stop_codon:yes gene_type:complete